MFADNTLTPKEATRLAALGTLALAPHRYGTLAVAIRHFIGHVLGPTPEIMGHSIELLKFEGLVEAADHDNHAELMITAAGRAELKRLLTARVRPAETALNKLVIALKFRFLHLLDRRDQEQQADMLADVCEQELTRIETLRDYHDGEAGYLVSFLDHDIHLLRQRLAWLAAFRDRLATGA